MNKILIWAAVVAVTIVLSLLGGCARQSATDASTEAALEAMAVIEAQVSAVEKTLATECKTEAVKAQLAALESTAANLRAQVKAIPAVCAAEKAELEEHAVKWKLYCAILLMLFAGAVAARLKGIL
jgi:DNA-binding FrmR family transcriptional regulator